MKITKNGLDTMAGPGDWFAGNVHIDVVSMPSPDSRVMGGIVHFAPGARTAWHTHPAGQTIFVTEGVGLVQRQGGPVEEVRPGDRVYIDAGENHWHGATPTRSTPSSPTRRPTTPAATPPGAVTSPTRNTRAKSLPSKAAVRVLTRQGIGQRQAPRCRAIPPPVAGFEYGS
jgi:quercetin dioxygenase-like cupin family protein